MPQERIRRYNKIELPIHFVWTTFERRPLLTPQIEQLVFRSIHDSARQMRCIILALNGMPDHIHLAVLFTPNLSISDFIKRVKGISSATVRDQYGTERFFQWEEGYAALAFPYSHRQKVIAYIENQKTHHAADTIYADWEEPTVLREGVILRPDDLYHN